jgi:hypothetical protein
MYNSTSREIDRLHDTLDDIRNSIHALEVNQRNLNSSFRQNSNVNTGSQNRMRSNRRNTPLETRPNQIYLNGRYYNIEYLTPNEYPDINRRDFLRNGIYNILDNLFTQENLQNLSEPVIVRPSNIEIQNSTINTTFNSIVSPINSSCPISLERFEGNTEVSQIIHCGHVFNRADLSVWFERNVRCPVCRYDIRRYSRRSRTSRQESQSENLNLNPFRENVNANVNTNVNTNANVQHVPNDFLQNENISNVQYNENGDISFDISMNPIVNLATQALNDLMRNPQLIQNTNNFFDPSNNPVLLFETIFRNQM